MGDNITGISRTSLWRSWKEIRKELRRSSVRDIVDFIEYDINPDVWINRLLERIRKGNYEPEVPSRFTLAKSKGFSRRMTLPHIPDLVLYRTIVDYFYTKFRRFEHEHVYFERGKLPHEIKEAKAAQEPVPLIWDKIGEAESPYEPLSRSTFRAWLCYAQYRKYLIFERVYPYIVTTDITNFFDSVLYCRLAEALHAVSAPPRIIGLLFFLLERLSIREPFTESPRIGLPVDEFGCSRKLAHMLLFSHDNRMVDRCGEDAYVRWMDDQNMGVESYAEGLRVLSLVNESLARLHLTPNAKKSNVLSLAEARRHFHLDLNEMLDEAETIKTETTAGRRALRAIVVKVWKEARKHEGIGQWDKVLKRLYLYAGRAGSRLLRRLAYRHAIEYPLLTARIADYVRCTGSVTSYLDFVTRLWSDERQVYADVNRVLIESLLRLEPDEVESSRICEIGTQLLRRHLDIPGAAECAATAPLILLRYADSDSLSMLRSVFTKEPAPFPIPVQRAAAIVYASAGPKHAHTVRKVASRLLRNHLSETVKMLDSIEEYDAVPERYSARISPSYDSVCGRAYIDMRSLVVVRLLGLNTNKKVVIWLIDKHNTLLGKSLTAFDARLLARLWPGTKLRHRGRKAAVLV